MNNAFKKDIQNKVITLLTSVKKGSLHILSADCCSEMARLVGYWILDDNAKSEAFIIKGNLAKKKRHDVLVVKTANSFTVIDPTVWQFYKKKRSIFMGTYNNIDEVIAFARSYYGGKWSISEKLSIIDGPKGKIECIAIIKQNLAMFAGWQERQAY